MRNEFRSIFDTFLYENIFQNDLLKYLCSKYYVSVRLVGEY